jgi:ABC-type transport system involved in cytochrome bd biosynthesis fused ATPase/permease subunit
MNDKEDFLHTIDKMPIDEVLRYKSAAIFTRRVIDILGVGFLLLLLLFPNVWMIIACTFFVFVLSNFSVTLDQFLTVIRDKLVKRLDK